MSLLFDALKRAQGRDAKQAPSQESANEAARTILAATKQPSIVPYAVAGAVVLGIGLLWFFYQQNQYIPLLPAPAELTAASSPASSVAAASSVLTASGVAELPATGSGADSLTYKDKSWTHPIEPKKATAKKRKAGKKPVKSTLLASSDPLSEGYRALSEGNLDLAEKNYLAVLAQRPHEKDALLGLAVIAQRKKQTDRATALYKQVLREDLGNAAAAAGLVSLSMQADLVSAESQIRELLDLKPSAPEFHYALGNILARQLRWGEAQQAYFRAFNLAPDNALYAYNLAVSLERLHQSGAAVPYYEKALQLTRDPTLDLEAIRRRIQELKGSQ